MACDTEALFYCHCRIRHTEISLTRERAGTASFGSIIPCFGFARRICATLQLEETRFYRAEATISLSRQEIIARLVTLIDEGSLNVFMTPVVCFASEQLSVVRAGSLARAGEARGVSELSSDSTFFGRVATRNTDRRCKNRVFHRTRCSSLLNTV